MRGWLGLVLLAGCSGTGKLEVEGTSLGTTQDGTTPPGTTPTIPGTTPTDPGTVPDELPVLFRCHDAPPPAEVATGTWNNLSTSLVALGGADHSADDILATDAGRMTLSAKFAYGLLSSDLQDEDVEVWIDDCSGAYVQIALATTDRDGRVHPTFDPASLPGFGSYSLVYRVKGDGTQTAATLSLFPVGTHLLVTDIDGTLTTSDTELFADLFSELLGGGYVPVERDASIETMWERTDLGWPLVYLTGRPYNLTDLTREWLADLHYPPGTVHLVPNTADILPTIAAVGEYKAEYLQGLLDQGFLLDGAYGNADTDIWAYAEAGIDPAATWILGDLGGDGGTVALGEDYLDHWATLQGSSPVVQPFEVP